MHPEPGARIVRHVGDRVRIRLDGPTAPGWRALLRTTLGRAKVARDEAVATLGGDSSFAGHAWRDVAMDRVDGGWQADLALAEVGWFRAKAFVVDPQGRQHWPAGDDLGLSVNPDDYRSANTIYCAFPRMFGSSKSATGTRVPPLDDQLAALDRHGYTVIPPSGTLRGLAKEVPHILDRLGCRILHLLPVNVVPTTFARMGRFGSPYACLDLTAIDPALVEFDRRTTAVDQFRELAYAVHLRGGRVFLDIVINHTGWGSRLMEEHPQWFKRNPDGTFHSPGAWGNTWEDLVELDHTHPKLWSEIADALITWCGRGVDGFRCDAGYMVPLPVWRLIVARVRQHHPEACFLLEGLGGAWSATETLLTEGGMQWAYSELFQNYSGPDVHSYLGHCLHQSERVGTLVHYSETHDNNRLAQGGRAWSLLRNRLCALTAVGGAFGFTNGVEWLATEKLEVHQARALNWGAGEHLCDELGRLNRLISDHPCFLDGAQLTILSDPRGSVLALRRDAGADRVLVLINLDPATPGLLTLAAEADPGQLTVDLLGQALPPFRREADGALQWAVPPGAAYCLSALAQATGLAGDEYRRARSRVAFAYQALAEVLPPEAIGPCPGGWQALAAWVDADPARFLACLPHLDRASTRVDLLAALQAATDANRYPAVVTWTRADLDRVVAVPPGHWILVRDEVSFSATLTSPGLECPRQSRSIAAAGSQIVAFPPLPAGTATLLLERFASDGRQATGALLALGLGGRGETLEMNGSGIALLTNGRGGMARIAADLGHISSKYDCALGANLHPSAPCDRHVFAKRLRAWINADGFITPLNQTNLARFQPGPPAHWVFVANAGDSRTVEVHLDADMLEGANTTLFRWSRPAGAPPWGKDLPEHCQVSIILRLDIEDRSFHGETQRDAGTEVHFARACRPLDDRQGFIFQPAPERGLRAWCDAGAYHHEAEWCERIPHPVEASRGLAAQGDAFSPGWFEFPLTRGAEALFVATAETNDPTRAQVRSWRRDRERRLAETGGRALLPIEDRFGRRLAAALSAFVVRRDSGCTVIAGYPWFLDWGRDTFIAARGLIAAGLGDEVRRILFTFARFEDGGTLPNLLNGDRAENRDTSDAPLWFGLAAAELAAVQGDGIFCTKIPDDPRSRTLIEVLEGIAIGYWRGTANGIRVDQASGLVWSPAHFTWMDTNHPACTPREGYPIEIQALWIRLCRLLARLGIAGPGTGWDGIAARATDALERFWLPGPGWFADQLIAPGDCPAAQAMPDPALRPNQLFLITLGLCRGERARSVVEACARHLIVPGAIRTLASLPLDPPLANRAADGRLLNDPVRPYWGHYTGDEDTRRKPAYHNGTAWVWPFPSYCEALVLAWEGQSEAVSAATSLLGSLAGLLQGGCPGQLPEIIDGDAPHAQRGCDAQAWSASEALRVWKWLRSMEPKPPVH